MNRTSAAVLLLVQGLLLVACEQTKSATPLSPSIAGPIAGVDITAPTPTTPKAGSQIASDAQPIVFTVANAETSGVRPLSYQFEIGIDANLVTKVYSQTGIAPGSGTTSLQMPQSLASDRTYHWRARAYDGANTGEWSAPTVFAVFTPVVIGVPTPASPNDGATLTTRTAQLVVQNAPVTGPAGAIAYAFEVATDAAMANKVVVAQAAAGSGQTTYTTPELTASTRFYWRARAFDGTRVGGYSAIRSFVTSAATGGGTTPPAPPNANDQIDLRTVQFVMGSDISGWAVTSAITSAGHTGDDMCINHTKAGKWPALPFFDTGATIEGNQWFFANINGKWLGGANEWLRPGQTCKVIDGHVGQGGFGGTALANWTPAKGEVVGVAVSTPARTGQLGGAERSNVVLITW